MRHLLNVVFALAWPEMGPLFHHPYGLVRLLQGLAVKLPLLVELLVAQHRLVQGGYHFNHVVVICNV